MISEGMHGDGDTYEGAVRDDRGEMEGGDPAGDGVYELGGRLCGEVCDAHAEDAQSDEVGEDVEDHLPGTVAQV